MEMERLLMWMSGEVRERMLAFEAVRETGIVRLWAPEGMVWVVVVFVRDEWRLKFEDCWQGEERLIVRA